MIVVAFEQVAFSDHPSTPPKYLSPDSLHSKFRSPSNILSHAMIQNKGSGEFHPDTIKIGRGNSKKLGEAQTQHGGMTITRLG